MKRVLITFLICIICAFTVLPLTDCNTVWAASDDWQNVTTNTEMVAAFKAYCKSRDVTIDGSVANAVTSFTTQTFNGIVNTLGIDVNVLQANLKYQTDNNTGIKFLFNAVSMNAFNRIFAQFLQDNDLAVGDSANDKVIYSNRYWESLNGYGAFVYVCTGTPQSVNVNDIFSKFGTPFYYDRSDTEGFVSGTKTSNLIKFSNTQDYYLKIIGNGSTNCYLSTDPSTRSVVLYQYSQNYHRYGYPIIMASGDRLYFGTFDDCYWSSYGSSIQYKTWTQYFEILTNTNSVNVNITVNSTNIKNETVINEGDTIIINNNGTTGDGKDPDPDPDPDPDDTYNPYPDGGGTTTPSGNTGGGSGEDDGTITFPDFDFNLPEIDWSIGNITDKFPFSIPFDLIAFFTVLNAEPEAPAIDTNIPLGDFYTWHFEADFSQFDNWAAIIRNVEFIGFIVGLIYLTIKFVKG